MGPESVREYAEAIRLRYLTSMDNALVIGALKTCWEAANRISGKRLAPFAPDLVERLEACHELQVDAATRSALVQLSASTIDRWLQGERRIFLKALHLG